MKQGSIGLVSRGACAAACAQKGASPRGHSEVFADQRQSQHRRRQARRSTTALVLRPCCACCACAAVLRHACSVGVARQRQGNVAVPETQARKERLPALRMASSKDAVPRFRIDESAKHLLHTVYCIWPTALASTTQLRRARWSNVIPPSRSVDQHTSVEAGGSCGGILCGCMQACMCVRVATGAGQQGDRGRGHHPGAAVHRRSAAKVLLPSQQCGAPAVQRGGQHHRCRVHLQPRK